MASVLLLLYFTAAYADPACRSVCITNKGFFVAAFRVKTYGKETDLSGRKGAGGGACWYRDELANTGEQLSALLPQHIHRRLESSSR